MTAEGPISLRLPDFILANIGLVLREWELFARSVWPSGNEANPSDLCDDAEDILRATVSDMRMAQTAEQQTDKSKGHGLAENAETGINRASVSHGAGRMHYGFDLAAVVAEYRALRASVLRLWHESGPTHDLHDLKDLTRFNESIDQSLAHAVRSYMQLVHEERDTMLAKEQAARAEAETANRAKDMFLATLSHEMRTPLNAIVGWTAILRTKNYQDEDLAEGLDIIDRNTKAQVQLIEDVLDVSRIVSGKLRLEMHDCDLRVAINAGLAAVRPAATAKDITIHVQFDPSASRAMCDAARIQQVIWNLVSNAVKFTQKGGKIRVALAPENSSWLITVADDGQGMSADLLPFVFDRFRQADSSTRRKFGGLGLGLSIVKHLVGAHGGTVEATSEGEGRGSTFSVRLPIKAVRTYEPVTGATETRGDDVTAATSGPPPMRLDGLRLLVVDDEADSRRMLEKVLTSVGATVTVANSVAAALALLDNATEQGNRPNVLISDLGMPDQDGYDLIRQVRQRGYQNRDLPAIALTGFAHRDDSRDAVLAGFQLHIPKPVDLHDLSEAIVRLAQPARS